jgi:DNA segregation ATPase FtsK/SpoIIIE-like protein
MCSTKFTEGWSLTMTDPQTTPDDDLYHKALHLIIAQRDASTSRIQRELMVGYKRASALIQRLEAAGVVSGLDENGKREVLQSDMWGECSLTW